MSLAWRGWPRCEAAGTWPRPPPSWLFPSNNDTDNDTDNDTAKDTHNDTGPGLRQADYLLVRPDIVQGLPELWRNSSTSLGDKPICSGKIYSILDLLVAQ